MSTATSFNTFTTPRGWGRDHFAWWHSRREAICLLRSMPKNRRPHRKKSAHRSRILYVLPSHCPLHGPERRDKTRRTSLGRLLKPSLGVLGRGAINCHVGHGTQQASRFALMLIRDSISPTSSTTPCKSGCCIGLRPRGCIVLYLEVPCLFVPFHVIADPCEQDADRCQKRRQREPAKASAPRGSRLCRCCARISQGERRS